ncbi:MAG: response regulator [Chloroflexota bacterium]|nr:response regulator [Chloroflexota bacterium]
MAGEKVLVVDDRDDSLQFLTEYILEPKGYQYIIAKDGETGLHKSLTESPDLIIMDLKMPKMTGLEVLSVLRERQPTIPVILMTFHGSEETAVQAFRLGARDYIIKPYDIQEMAESIERALTEVRLRAERDQLTQNIMQVNRQLERRVQELSILYSIGKSVTTLLDSEKVLNRIVEAAVYVTGAEEGSLMLVDEESGELYMRATRGLGEKYARGFRLRVEDSIAGQVVKTGQPFLESGDAQRLKVKTGYLVKSLMYVPLKAGQDTIGVLSVDNKVSNTPFTESDVYLLSALADYAAIAIVNSRLFTEVKSFSEELEQKVVERTTELQQTQEQLIQSEKLASIGQLAAGVAHELNNPISVMLGFAQAILRKLPKDDPLGKPLSTIEREGLRCKGIIQNLLDFARRRKPALQPTDVNEVLEAACSLIEHQIALDNVAVMKGYDPNLPRVLADANQLQQVFVNIIVNARDAMPQGGTLRLTTRSLGNEVQIIFSDTGIGIPPEQVKRIFDPFFTTKEVGQGTGLGLSVSYGIIEQHGGSIEVESEVGVGTTFILKLPIVQGKVLERKEALVLE